MAKKILINAAFPEETRVAIVQNGKLLDFDIESQEYFRTKSNIYKGVITRLEPGLEAVFVNYGEERNGFLPTKEIITSYFDNPKNRDNTRNINNLFVGQELIVQVDKEARKDKGAALTTHISLAGRYMVLMRGAPKTHSVSRRGYGSERARTEQISKTLRVPDEFGIIVRTAGIGKSKGDLMWDLNYLKSVWAKIEEEAAAGEAPFLILQEGDVITRTLRDQLADDTLQIVADTQDAYDMAKAIISHAVPAATQKLELYESNIPLFTHYDIERQIQTAFQHIVKLPSGGRLVFDRTEAMFIIDVNSSQSTQGSDVENTALTNNLEATKEIARQMKIRDIGGLVVIDFIDMADSRNKNKIEDAFRQEVQSDRARVRLGKISRFGMMELSRQRLRSSLDEFYLTKCPHCNGAGTIRTNSALATHLRRLLWDSIQDPNTKKIDAEVPEKVYDLLLKHNDEYSLEKTVQKYKDKIAINSNRDLKSPHFTITTIYQSGKDATISSFDEIESTNLHYAQPESARKRKPLLTPQDISSQVEPRRVSIIEKIGDFFGKLFKPAPKRKYSSSPRRGRYRSSSRSYQGRYHRSSRYKNDRYKNDRYRSGQYTNGRHTNGRHTNRRHLNRSRNPR